MVPGGDPPAFEEWYDSGTLSVLDAWADVRTRAGADPPVPSWRRRTVAGVLAGALVVGLRDVLADDGARPPVIELVPAGGDHGRPVVVHLVPGAAAVSIAVVRPWLF